MLRVPVKAISVNTAWQGRRFKTTAYKRWEAVFMAFLNKLKSKAPQPVKLGKRLFARYEVGQSNPRADCDNPIKLIQDTLFKFWDIKSDHNIEFLIIQKTPVQKGGEFIGFCVDDMSKLSDYLRDLADEIEQREGK